MRISIFRIRNVENHTNTSQTNQAHPIVYQRVSNVCEIKFAKGDFTIDKAYAKKMRNKTNLFSQLDANKRKNIFLTMITTFGVTNNEYHKELVQSEVVLEDLFSA